MAEAMTENGSNSRSLPGLKIRENWLQAGRLPSRTRLRRLEAKASKWLGSATCRIRRSVSADFGVVSRISANIARSW
jgi:hypothetical protein